MLVIHFETFPAVWEHLSAQNIDFPSKPKIHFKVKMMCHNFMIYLQRLHLKIGRRDSAQILTTVADGPGCWFLSIKQRDVTHIFSRIDVDKSKDQPNRDPMTDLTRQKWILGLDAIWRF